MGSRLGITVRPVESLQEAVSGADIVVTVADEPIVKDAWMKPGSLFAAIGSYQEKEFAVVENSDELSVDSLTPTPEHQRDYERVKEELIGLGIPMT